MATHNGWSGKLAPQGEGAGAIASGRHLWPLALSSLPALDAAPRAAYAICSTPSYHLLREPLVPSQTGILLIPELGQVEQAEDL